LKKFLGKQSQGKDAEDPQSSMGMEDAEPCESQVDVDEFKVVRKRRPKAKKKPVIPVGGSAKVDTAAPNTLKAVQGKRRRPPRTQAVVLEKPGDKSYADTVKEVKETVLEFRDISQEIQVWELSLGDA